MKTGPARIRMSFSRPLKIAEVEALHGTIDWDGGYAQVTTRLNGNQKLWLESKSFDSRTLFNWGAELIDALQFVNIYPTAVRTFRELS